MVDIEAIKERQKMLQQGLWSEELIGLMYEDIGALIEEIERLREVHAKALVVITDIDAMLYDDHSTFGNTIYRKVAKFLEEVTDD